MSPTVSLAAKRMLRSSSMTTFLSAQYLNGVNLDKILWIWSSPSVNFTRCSRNVSSSISFTSPLARSFFLFWIALSRIGVINPSTTFRCFAASSCQNSKNLQYLPRIPRRVITSCPSWNAVTNLVEGWLKKSDDKAWEVDGGYGRPAEVESTDLPKRNSVAESNVNLATASCTQNRQMWKDTWH